MAENDIMPPDEKFVRGERWLSKAMGANDFIHSELLALVDREGRIRGYYDGTDEQRVRDMISDIKSLQMDVPVN